MAKLAQRNFRFVVLAEALCLLLSCLCIIIGNQKKKNGEMYFQNITLQAEQEGFTAEELQFITENESLYGNRGNPAEKASTATAENTEKAKNAAGDNPTEESSTATAWSEQKEETVTDDLSKRSGQADVIAIYGSSHCLFPFGKNLAPEDADGCLVSRPLAECLFGDFSAENQKIRWNGHVWTVRGILPLASSCLIVQTAGRNLGLLYSRLSIAKTENAENDSPVKSANDFLLRHHLSARIMRFDYFYHWDRFTELIPGKWSDFDGWKTNWKQQEQNLRFLKQTERFTPESIGLRSERQGRLFWAAGMLLGIVAVLLLCRKPLLHDSV